MKKILAYLLMFSMAASLVGCSSSNNEEEVEEETICIAAAASLENAFEEELIAMFNEEYPNVTVEGTYDSSGKLQEQIEGGLEADVFFSAATKQMDALTDEDYIDSDTRVDLLENKVVLIVSTNSSLDLKKFEDITKAGSIALGDPASVPAGQYAQEALTNLNLWDEVNTKASFGTNVTEVLNQVAEGSAEAGVVYATDAASMPDKVKIIAEAPADSLATPVVYPVATLKNSKHSKTAKAFVEFLQSDKAIEVFEKYGFSKN